MLKRFTLLLLSLCLATCTRDHTTLTSISKSPTALTPSTDSTEIAIRYLERQIKINPEDFIAYHKLADYYHQRARELGDPTYLELAGRAARNSLEILPPEQNPAALAALIRYNFASHNFAQARDDARTLINLKPDDSEPYLLYADASLELGDYTAAARAYADMQRRTDPTRDYAAAARLSHQAFLHNDLAAAREWLNTAIVAAQQVNGREPLAWCYAQQAELALMQNDFSQAERFSRVALDTLPDYFRALAILARTRAAQGDLTSAIELYHRAVARSPDISTLAALADLYTLANQPQLAVAQHRLIATLVNSNNFNSQLYRRQLALYYADTNTNLTHAYDLARQDYEHRQDIYAADALAWTAFKLGRKQEAQNLIKQALRFNTPDPKLKNHAAAINKN